MRACLRILPCLLLATSAFAQDGGLDLNCDHADPRNAGVEPALIKQLGGGLVKRVSAHELAIQAGGRTLRVQDEPPYDEPFSGVQHQFCDRRGGFILLQTQSGTDFTGTLVNEATGQVTPGGEQVLLSVDRRAYLAAIQPDGLDGMEWKVYAIGGKVSWEGFDFIEDPQRAGYMIASLGNPRWTSTGELKAEATCVSPHDRHWPVTLRKIGGQWDWSPKPAACERER